MTIQIFLQYSYTREPNPAAWLLQGLVCAIIIYFIVKYRNKKAETQYNAGGSSTTFGAFNGIPTYKKEVPDAIKRLYEWKSDIPAIIIVSTDLIYKNEIEKAYEILINGDTYNDKVFAVKCLLGHCYFLKFEKEKAYECAKTTVELINSGKLSITQYIELYKIIGRLLPEAIYNLAVISNSKADSITSTTLYKFSCSFDENYKNKPL